MNTARIPRTDSIQELANFWDSHNVTDFEDELEEVTDRVFERDTEITVSLTADEANAIQAMAKSREVPDSKLIREWVVDRLHAT